jgi:hypothetical protein
MSPQSCHCIVQPLARRSCCCSRRVDQIKTEDIKSILLAKSGSMKGLLLSSSAPSPHPFSFLVAELDRETTDQEINSAYDSALALLAKAQAHLVKRNVFKIHRRGDKQLHSVTGRERSENPLYLCLLFRVDEKAEYNLVVRWSSSPEILEFDDLYFGGVEAVDCIGCEPD